MPLDPERYLNERLEQYRSWYDKKAVTSKSRYLKMRGFTVIAGGLVPVLANIPELSVHGYPLIRILLTIVSLLVVVAVSLESVLHYREQWKNYRSTEQFLGHERFLYESSVGPYRDLSVSDAFQLLVQRSEDAIAAENTATLNVMTMAEQAASSSQPKPNSDRRSD
jgi:hypothetical protein